MRGRLFYVDAFATSVFRGNPAAVCILDQWPTDATLQAIAAENNQAATAFLIESDNRRLRWFAPSGEEALCGHATLASAFVLFEVLGFSGDALRFDTLSGTLEVRRDGDLFVMDFPVIPSRTHETMPAQLLQALDSPPTAVLETADRHFAVYGSEAEIGAAKPDLDRLAAHGIIRLALTAPGHEVDFVSRYFTHGREDAVTGSTHCTLVPYWAARLHRTRLHARQLSPRQGDLFCEARADRVLLGGHAVLYAEGQFQV